MIQTIEQIELCFKVSLVCQILKLFQPMVKLVATQQLLQHSQKNADDDDDDGQQQSMVVMTTMMLVMIMTMMMMLSADSADFGDDVDDD